MSEFVTIAPLLADPTLDPADAIKTLEVASPLLTFDQFLGPPRGNSTLTLPYFYPRSPTLASERRSGSGTTPSAALFGTGCKPEAGKCTSTSHLRG